MRPLTAGLVEAPYGTWSSTIDGAAVARDPGWMYSLVTADGGDVHWSESRPLERGRDAIVVRREGFEPVDAIPARFVARSRPPRPRHAGRSAR